MEHPRGNGVGKSAGRVRAAVGIGKIGLHVENGRSVHKIGAAHNEHRPFAGIFDPLELHAGETDVVRAEGAAARKHADALVAAEPRRAHGGGERLTLAHRGGKLPEKPDMGKLLQPAHGVSAAVFRAEYYPRFKRLGKSALLGNAELRREIRADMRHRVHENAVRCMHR